MKSKLLLLICVITICSCSRLILPENRVDLECYYSSIRLKNKNISETFYTEIKDRGEDFVRIGCIYEKGKDSRITRTQFPFAIVMDKETYINIGYSPIYGKHKDDYYIKFDIVGRFCAKYTIDDYSVGVKDKSRAFDFGWSGRIIERKIYERNKGWLAADGKKYKILCVNSGKAELGYNALVKLLSKKYFNEQLNTNYSKEEVASFSFEDVVKIIKELNSESIN